ncbi:MAG: MFS transporter, partial [archaeon]|nr:MFS transporter [archaeon]
MILQLIETNRVILNLICFVLGSICISTMYYQWIRHSCSFTQDSKSTIASLIQGIGTIISGIINLFAEKGTSEDVTKLSRVHFVIAMICLWGSFLFIICMKLDQSANTIGEEPMLSNAIDTDRKEEVKEEPTITIIANKFDIQLENYKNLPIEKKVMGLLTAKNNYMYMGIITLLLAGMNFSYFLNVWYNKLLPGDNFIEETSGRMDYLLKEISKAPLTIDGNRLYPEIAFPLFQMLFGYLADNFAKRYQILFAYVCSGASTVLLFFIEKGTAQRILCFIFSAIGYGAMTAVLLRLMMDKYLVKNIMDSVTIFGICYYVSIIICGYISLFIIAYIKNINKLIIAILGCAIIVAIFMIMFIKEPFIVAPHYFDANYVDEPSANGDYKQPKIEDAGQLFEDKGEGMNTLEDKIKDEGDDKIDVEEKKEEEKKEEEKKE